MRAPGFTVMVHRDGALKTRQFHVPRWAVRLSLVLGAAGLVLVVLVIATYGPIVVAAARTPLLERRIAQLAEENQRVTELAAALDEAEARYAHLRGMLGADLALPTGYQRGGDGARQSSEGLYVAPPILARARSVASKEDSAGPSVPHLWPLSAPSYRTRGMVAADSAQELHPGLDLAVPVGSDVRASGGGVAKAVGSDPDYGLYVLLQHPDGYETRYGHLSRVLVTRAETVRGGQVIGLSGNTGRSTAPHLHFEVRRHNRSVDPLSLVREGR